MVKEIEGQFKVGDTSLYTKTWLPDGPVTNTKAKLVFVHGFSDHVGRYYGFFPHLAGAGIAVYAFDQRGWGQSVSRPADRGHTGPTAQVLADVAAFITGAALPAEPAAAPLFVMGHSMGGGEVLALASTAAYEESVVARVRGWVLEAPFIDFPAAARPGAFKVMAGRLAGRVLPRMKLANPIPPEDLTRDPAVVQSLRDDALCHDTGTLEGLAGLLDRTAELAGGRYRLSPRVQSLWLGHGDMDKATCFDSSKAWFDRQAQIPDREFKTYAGAFHQLHADTDREEFYKDVERWILARCDDGPGEGAAASGDAATKEAESSQSQGGDKVDAKL
ncbi:serine hydrolase-like protein [Diaporthe amygdali]|uniref:serine hydrolase-like protein n=1 Tax=Phomopsis amygdali TaxID=1214568 RepID=UPI0022FDCD8A|nr:serine hydrolase-like protein [Diaporthe amygdali]KAJ0116226.1 serine hydrolase-like protein [Diaporthe amygdali]